MRKTREVNLWLLQVHAWVNALFIPQIHMHAHMCMHARMNAHAHTHTNTCVNTK